MKIAITVWQRDTTGGPSTSAGSVLAGPVGAATSTAEARLRAVASPDHAAKDAKYATSARVSGPNAPADIAANMYTIAAPPTAGRTQATRRRASVAPSAPTRDSATTRPNAASPARGEMGSPVGQSIAARPSAISRSPAWRAASSPAPARLASARPAPPPGPPPGRPDGDGRRNQEAAAAGNPRPPGARA